MKTKEIKVYNLPEDRIINESIEAKPYFLIVLEIIFGCFVTFKWNTAVGLSLIFFGISVLMFMPRRTLMEFQDDYMILYNKAVHNDCTIVYYDEVASWRYIYGIKMDELQIELNDGSFLSVEAFNKFTFESLMNRYLKEKKHKGK